MGRRQRFMVDGSCLEYRFLQGAQIFKESCWTVAPSTDGKNISDFFRRKDYDVLQSIGLDGLYDQGLMYGSFTSVSWSSPSAGTTAPPPSPSAPNCSTANQG